MTPLAKDVESPAAPPARSDGGLVALMASGRRPARQPAPAAAPPAQARPRVTSLSVVIPAKNEARNLRPLLAELTDVLAEPRRRGVAVELLVIDDGSGDDTAAVAAAAGARVVSHAESLGNGAAVKRGIREARHGWVLMLDGDGQHPPQEIPVMLALAERYDMVVGSRGGGGGAWYRNLANRIYNGLASYVTSRRIPDLTSGFRLVRADVLKGFAYLLPNTFSYPTTITLAMLRAGYAVGFHPIAVRTRGGRSHIRLLSDGSRFLLIILRIATFFAPLRVFGPLAAATALLGLAWYGWTFATSGRFTNMAVLLLAQATMVFGLGLVSEQIAALRFDRSTSHHDVDSDAAA